MISHPVRPLKSASSARRYPWLRRSSHRREERLGVGRGLVRGPASAEYSRGPGPCSPPGEESQYEHAAASAT